MTPRDHASGGRASLALLAALLAGGCGKPPPSLQGAWSMGPGGLSLGFEGARYVEKRGDVDETEASVTWTVEDAVLRTSPEQASVSPIVAGKEGTRSMEEELRSAPVAWRLEWIDPDAFEATARNGAAAAFRRTPQ